MFPPKEVNTSCHTTMFILVGVAQGVPVLTEKEDIYYVQKEK